MLVEFPINPCRPQCVCMCVTLFRTIIQHTHTNATQRCVSFLYYTFFSLAPLLSGLTVFWLSFAPHIKEATATVPFSQTNLLQRDTHTHTHLNFLCVRACVYFYKCMLCVGGKYVRMPTPIDHHGGMLEYVNANVKRACVRVMWVHSWMCVLCRLRPCVPQFTHMNYSCLRRAAIPSSTRSEAHYSRQHQRTKATAATAHDISAPQTKRIICVHAYINLVGHSRANKLRDAITFAFCVMCGGGEGVMRRRATLRCVGMGAGR